MRKAYSAALALIVCVAMLVPAAAAVPARETFPAAATNNTIVVSSGTDEPDAHIVRPAVYKIEGANYFKLRDLAMILYGSGKQFEVEYDDASKSVLITSGKPYTAVGGELSGTAAEKCSAAVSDNTVFIDGSPVTLKA